MDPFRKTPTVAILGVLVLLLSGCLTVPPAANNITPSVSAPGITRTAGGAVTPAWGKRTKISACAAVGVRPDPACTPGDVVAVSKEELCQPGYATGVRNVTESEKEMVYAEYGIASHSPGEYEVDHFVSLELGGSNDISNLWPEPAAPKPGFHEKDKVENYLHDQVCTGAMTLQEAQIKIATSWLDVYNSMPK